VQGRGITAVFGCIVSTRLKEHPKRPFSFSPHLIQGDPFLPVSPTLTPLPSDRFFEVRGRGSWSLFITLLMLLSFADLSSLFPPFDIDSSFRSCPSLFWICPFFFFSFLDKCFFPVLRLFPFPILHDSAFEVQLDLTFSLAPGTISLSHLSDTHHRSLSFSLFLSRGWPKVSSNFRVIIPFDGILGSFHSPNRPR